MLLIAQIVNFLIIFFILKRFAYKPVLEILKKREEEIKKGLKEAEESQKLLENAEQKEREILQKAQVEAEKMISDAKKEAQEEKDLATTNAKTEAEKILEQARLTISQETKEAEDQLTRKVGGIAITLLEKSLKGIFGEKEQKILIEKATKAISKEN